MGNVSYHLPEASQGTGVDYWRPVWKVLGAGLPCSWLVLAWNLWVAGETAILSQSASGVLVKLLF